MKYGVIESTVERIEGDERSRTHPGHGYPAHNVTRQTFHEFNTDESLKVFLKRNESFLHRMRVIKFEDVTISKEVVINLA